MGIIGSIMRDNELFAEVSEIIDAEAFYGAANRLLFRGINELIRSGKTADPVTIGDWLRVNELIDQAGGMKTIIELRDQAISTTTYLVDLNGQLHKFCDSVGYGLPYDDALKAITLNVAEMFGFGDKLGSLDVGKMANVVVANGDPLDVRTDVKQVYIEGVSQPMVSRQTILRDEYSK